MAGEGIASVGGGNGKVEDVVEGGIQAGVGYLPAQSFLVVGSYAIQTLSVGLTGARLDW